LAIQWVLSLLWSNQHFWLTFLTWCSSISFGKDQNSKFFIVQSPTVWENGVTSMLLGPLTTQQEMVSLTTQMQFKEL
jgi:hypothetical protein